MKTKSKKSFLLALLILLFGLFFTIQAKSKSDSTNIQITMDIVVDSTKKNATVKVVNVKPNVEKALEKAEENDCKKISDIKTSKWINIIFRILGGIFLILVIYFGFFTDILKDPLIKNTINPTIFKAMESKTALEPKAYIDEIEKKQYSLAKCIGFWWTAIIILCIIFGIGENHGNIIGLNTTCLVLLGIGVGTTVIGFLIDKNDIEAQVKPENQGITIRHQDRNKHKGFLWDLLNDGANNYSIHRFQVLVFNVIFGIAFMIEFSQNLHAYMEGKILSCEIFPYFNSVTLGLLGVSSSIFLVVKKTENTSK